MTSAHILPEYRPADTWAMGVWQELRGRLAAGNQLGVFRWRCEDEQMSEIQMREMWARVTLIDNVISSYFERLAEMQARRAGRG